MSGDSPLTARGCIATAFDYRGKQLGIMNFKKQSLNHLKNPEAGMSLYNGSETIKKGALVVKFNGTVISHQELKADEEAVHITTTNVCVALWPSQARTAPGTSMQARTRVPSTAVSRSTPTI